jgi:hypothetical protein
MAATGERISFADHDVEVIVTKAGDGEVTATEGEGVQVGKRYECEVTGVQVLVLKAGAVSLYCEGRPMQLQEPKKTKAGD